MEFVLTVLIFLVTVLNVLIKDVLNVKTIMLLHKMVFVNKAPLMTLKNWPIKLPLMIIFKNWPAKLLNKIILLSIIPNYMHKNKVIAHLIAS